MTKAIVTGDSRGLGAALATQLSEAGAEVLGISRSSIPSVDLSNPDALTAWLDGGELAAFLDGASDIILINNAGTVAPSALVGQADPAAIVAAVNLNVTAPLLLTDAVLRLRPEGATVRIAHISSGAGRHAYPGWAVYCATKAALDLHAQALAAENQDGVRVASIAPGIVDTDMQGDIRASDGFPLRDRFVAYKQEGRLASPDVAARQVLTIIDSPRFGSEVIVDVRG